MKISNIALSLPKTRVTNSDVLNLIREKSINFEGDLDKTLSVIDRLLKQNGSADRYWTNGSGETSLDVTLSACKEALAPLENQKIDMVICASVFSELVEPATSNLIAHMLGLDEAECVDIKEACDGWMKATKFADSLIKSGVYDRILIVNGEFSLVPNYAIMPHLFALTSPKELEWRFPIFTIGEGATATIVERDPQHPWAFSNKTRNDLYDLCTVAPTWHKSGVGSDKIGKDGSGLFTSWANELTENGIPLAIETFKDSGIKPLGVDILFTHASSTRDWSKISHAIGLHNKWFDIHGQTGNLVSASVPASVALATKRGALRRGDDVAVLCASAGMTFSTASFRF